MLHSEIEETKCSVFLLSSMFFLGKEVFEAQNPMTSGLVEGSDTHRFRDVQSICEYSLGTWPHDD